MPTYRAFLLRCWSAQAPSADPPLTWRFSLEEVGPERHPLGFASLEALVAYLRSELSDGEQFRSIQPCELLAEQEARPSRGDNL